MPVSQAFITTDSLQVTWRSADNCPGQQDYFHPSIPHDALQCPRTSYLAQDSLLRHLEQGLRSWFFPQPPPIFLSCFSLVSWFCPAVFQAQKGCPGVGVHVDMGPSGPNATQSFSAHGKFRAMCLHTISSATYIILCFQFILGDTMGQNTKRVKSYLLWSFH